MSMKAVNWSTLPSDDMHLRFWKQNNFQLWYPEKYAPSKDKGDWLILSKAEQRTFNLNLVRPTGLDTVQGSMGMSAIGIHKENLFASAIMSFMNMME